jgi:hypothetical protein
LGEFRLVPLSSLKHDYFNLVEKQYGVQPKALMCRANDLKEISDCFKQPTGSDGDRILTKPLGRSAVLVALGVVY